MSDNPAFDNYIGQMYPVELLNTTESNTSVS